MMQENPRVKEAKDLIDQAGGDPNLAFQKKCKEMGVNPEDILSLLQ